MSESVNHKLTNSSNVFYCKILSLQYFPLTKALCSRLALPREITLFFLEPRAKVNLSPGNSPGGSWDRSRCPLGVSVQIFGSVGKREWREEDGGKEQIVIKGGRKRDEMERTVTERKRALNQLASAVSLVLPYKHDLVLSITSQNKCSKMRLWPAQRGRGGFNLH